MHDSQKKLLSYLNQKEDLEGVSYWDIARETGLVNAQNVVHHLKQLEKKGYLRRDPSNSDKFELLKSPIEDIVYLNLYNFAHCTSRTDFFSIDNQKQKIAVSTTLLGIGKPEDYFAVRAKGNSMVPKIHDNDVVICKKQSTAESGQITLVRIDDECKIKQFLPAGKFVLLKSLNNEEHPDIVVSKNNNLEILGIAKQIIHHI